MAGNRGGGSAPGGGKVASTEAAKRLEINWQVRQLPRSYRTGYEATALPLGALFDRSDLPGTREVKPAVIWFSKLETDEKLEKKMFDSMEVAVSSRWFDCVRIYVDDIENKAEREDYSKTLPLLVFLDGSGREVSRVGGSAASTSAVYASMQKAAHVDFKAPLTAMVDKYRAFLKKFDKVQAKVSDLESEIAADVEHIAKHDCAPGRRRLKENEAELKPLRVEHEKLLAEEQAILKPELKPKS